MSPVTMTSPAVTWLDGREAEAIRFLEALVNQDSGTYDREDVNVLADMLAGPLGDLGFAPTRFPQSIYGDHWLWERRGRGPKRLLCVSHLDTVFARGTARARPFSVVGARAMGPGVLDMKGGITSLLFAFRALAATASPAWRETTIAWFLNSDEEVLSPTSRPLIRAEAERSTSVAVTEPARPGGEYVIARKGAAKFFLEVTGRLRAWSPAAAEKAIAHFREIAEHPHVDGTTARLWGDMNFPPWPEGLPGTMTLLALMQEAGRELGLSLRGIPTGGGSDGNHASGVAPTIDGLGPQGSLAHNPDEYIELPTLIERARVDARFIELWTERFTGLRAG